MPVWPWSSDLPLDPADVMGFPSAAAVGALGALPLPAAGATVERLALLAEVAAIDLSVGRLVEGHADATAILAEAGVAAPGRSAPGSGPGALGVWAAASEAVTASPVGDRWRLRGTKPWCSGASSLARALVTAAAPDGPRLFVVDLSRGGVDPDPMSWPAVGMAGSDTLDVAMDVTVDGVAALGDPGWYTDRAGFWFGSIGVAACWLGGALGAVRVVAAQLRRSEPDPHRLAALGGAAARCQVLAAGVQQAGRWIDGHPCDPERQARPIALGLRQAVEEGCLAVMAEVGRAGGAGHVTRHSGQARRLADLAVYVRQHHAGRDAAAFASALLEAGLGGQ